MFLELNFPWSYILGQYILYAFYCFPKQCWITSSNWQGCNHSLFTDDNSSCKYKSIFHFSNSSLVLPGYSTGNYFSLTFISSWMMWVQAWIGRCFAWKHGFYPWALNVNVIIYLTWAIFICKVFWGSLRWHIELARAGRWREDILGTSVVAPNGRVVTLVCFERQSFWVFFWLSCHALQLLAVYWWGNMTASFQLQLLDEFKSTAVHRVLTLPLFISWSLDLDASLPGGCVYLPH